MKASGRELVAPRTGLELREEPLARDPIGETEGAFQPGKRASRAIPRALPDLQRGRAVKEERVSIGCGGSDSSWHMIEKTVRSG